MTDDDTMAYAIGVALRNPFAPFGAVVLDANGQVIGEGVNESNTDPTWHGEMRAISDAATGKPDWTRCTLATTAEPCPMCMAAALWAGIRRVVYGTSIPTLQTFGWWQIDLRASELIRLAPGRRCDLVGGVREAECDVLFRSARKANSG
jgi:tRNA(adenine34) deaminase